MKTNFKLFILLALSVVLHFGTGYFLRHLKCTENRVVVKDDNILDSLVEEIAARNKVIAGLQNQLKNTDHSDHIADSLAILNLKLKVMRSAHEQTLDLLSVLPDKLSQDLICFDSNQVKALNKIRLHRDILIEDSIRSAGRITIRDHLISAQDSGLASLKDAFDRADSLRVDGLIQIYSLISNNERLEKRKNTWRVIAITASGFIAIRMTVKAAIGL